MRLSVLAALCVSGLAAGLVHGSTLQSERGGIFRVVARAADFDSLDPALSYTAASGALLGTTCAPLTEVAGSPRISHDGKTYMFTLRAGFRFSDGTRAGDAFARAINRTLAPAMNRRGRRTRATSSAPSRSARAGRPPAQASRPREHARRPAEAARPRLPPGRTSSAPCHRRCRPIAKASPPSRRRPVLRRRAPPGRAGRDPAQPLLRRHAGAPRRRLRRRPAGELARRGARPHRARRRRLGLGAAARLLRPGAPAGGEVRRQQVAVLRPAGLDLRGYVLNTSRPLFRDNPRLRRAVNFAIDRSAFRRIAGGPLESSSPTSTCRRDARLQGCATSTRSTAPTSPRASARARQHAQREGRPLHDRPARTSPSRRASSRTWRRSGSTSEIKALPVARRTSAGSWPRGPTTSASRPGSPDYDDPYAVLNVQLDGRFIGATNWPRFDSPEYNRLLRRAASPRGPARYRAYGELDARLARDAAPMVAIDFLNDPTLVSKRVGCVSRSFDLAAVCLK